jgi:hypothetical protein
MPWSVHTLTDADAAESMNTLLSKSPYRMEKPKSYTVKNQHQWLIENGDKTGSSNNHVICYMGSDGNALESVCVSTCGD